MFGFKCLALQSKVLKIGEFSKGWELLWGWSVTNGVTPSSCNIGYLTLRLRFYIKLASLFVWDILSDIAGAGLSDNLDVTSGS